jgi:hypothetical protein
VLLLCCLASFVPAPGAIGTKNKVQSRQEENGIRVIVENNFELYFNVTNGGEITEYFDLILDPYRSRNLVNIGWNPYHNLLPLFSSIFYNPYLGKILSTGGDSSAILRLIANTSSHAILQTSSRIMSRSNEIARDAYGDVIYVDSTWIIRSSGVVSVERTLLIPSYAPVPSGWRWYPFYLTRRAGFNYNGTFDMFNTTYTKASTINEGTYRNVYDLFSLLPSDAMNVFGVALPFSNTSIGGDGTHNIIISYKYDELIDTGEWRSDNYYSQSNQILESGAVHEFKEPTNISTHTYHMMMNLTHQQVSNESVQGFATYYANNTNETHLIRTSITTDKSSYTYGDTCTVYASGVSYYDLTGITAVLTAQDKIGRTVFMNNYGPGGLTQGQHFTTTLASGTIQPGVYPGNYTITFRILSSAGITIASDSKTIQVT